MDLSKQRVMVIGLGKSGFDLVSYLEQRAAKVIAFDSNAELASSYEDKGFKNVEFHFGSNPTGEEAVDLAVISPGIPTDLDFVQKLRKYVRVIGEVELAYEMAKGRFIGITGTNGKTTTTALTGALFKNAGFDTKVVGNIGKPIISEVQDSNEQTIFVTELSSFQLESIEDFHCHCATIVNITPDHLNRHKTMENYRAMKKRIFENQQGEDYAVINADDVDSMAMASELKAKKIYTTVRQSLDIKPRIDIQDGKIYYHSEESSEYIMDTADIFLKGEHNYENALIAIGIAWSFGVDKQIIAETLRTFQGVEHRLEFVREVDGIRFVNDSKGTNPDAAIKAIEAMEKSIILIAGGMDKGSSFDGFVEAFSNRVKSAILLGETKHTLAETMRAHQFLNFTLVNTMEEAVQKAFSEAQKGDVVLLSPACASWDMYASFEVRGEHFKQIVNELEVKNGE